MDGQQEDLNNDHEELWDVEEQTYLEGLLSLGSDGETPMAINVTPEQMNMSSASGDNPQFWNPLSGLFSNNNGGGAGGGGGGGGDDPYDKVMFENVRGLDDQIAQLKTTVISTLKDDSLKRNFGIDPPKGILFWGPPGTGKTLLARAFGNEASQELGRRVSFYHTKGGELKSKWFGESQQIIKQLFEKAKANKPSIIFLDELDGICPSRDNCVGEASKSVVTAILGQMDSIKNGEVFVFGATNLLESVDPAVIRPGRFDLHMEFMLPDLESRKAMAILYTTKWPNSPKPEEDPELLDHLGEKTVGFTGADMENLCREAFYAAYLRHIPDIDSEDTTLANMQVLKEDWTAAISNTKPSVVNCFGNADYVPSLPPPSVNPLISGIQEEILEELKRQLPEEITPNTAYVPAIVQTVYIWDDKAIGSHHSLYSFIMPGIFTNAALGRHRIFEMKKPDLQGQNQVSYIQHTLQKVSECRDPCILFMPEIEAFAEALNFVGQRVFWRKLESLRGKHVLLLATGERAPGKISCPELATLLLGKPSIEVAEPSIHHKHEFFNVIATSVKSKYPNLPSLELEKICATLKDKTARRSVYEIVILGDRLNHSLLMSTDITEFRAEFRDLLNRLQKKGLYVR